MTIFLCLVAYCGLLSLVLYAQQRGSRLGEMFDLEPKRERQALGIEVKRSRS